MSTESSVTKTTTQKETLQEKEKLSVKSHAWNTAVVSAATNSVFGTLEVLAFGMTDYEVLASRTFHNGLSLAGASTAYILWREKYWEKAEQLVGEDSVKKHYKAHDRLSGGSYGTAFVSVLYASIEVGKLMIGLPTNFESVPGKAIVGGVTGIPTGDVIGFNKDATDEILERRRPKKSRKITKYFTNFSDKAKKAVVGTYIIAAGVGFPAGLSLSVPDTYEGIVPETKELIEKHTTLDDMCKEYETCNKLFYSTK